MKAKSGKSLNEEAGKDHLSEPEIAYSKPRLRFFNSFEEMNDADSNEMALTSGIEHLMNVTLLLKQFYASELEKPMDKKIHFK